MKMKKANRYGIITIFFASLFMIIQRVLITATVVPEYAQNPTRFYVYNILLALTAVGGNLLALYMGYFSNKLEKSNSLKMISRFYLIYLLLAIMINIFCASVNIRDYWIILFPISQNLFGFAVSFILIFIFGSMITSNLNKLSDIKLKSSFILVSIFLVVLPTLFGKDVFYFSEGKSVLWIAYVFFVGYFINRFHLIERYRYKILHLVISLVMVSFLIIIMTKVSMYLHQNVTSANRFSVPWSLFSMYYSVNLFIIFESINKKIKILSLAFKTISSYMITIQVLLFLPVINNMISEKYKVPFPDSALDWAKRIILLVIIYFVISLLLNTLVLLLQKIPIFLKIDKKFQIQNLLELFDKLLIIKEWFYARRKLFFVAIFFYFFTILQMFLLSDYQNRNATITSLLRIFTQRQAPIFLNIIIIMAFFMLVFLITKRFWYAFAFTLIVDSLLTVSTVIKVKLRADPILPSDLVFISNINEIFNMVSPIIILVSIIVLIILAISTGIIQHRASKVYNLQINNKKRIAYIVVILMSFSGVFFINHQRSPSNLLFNFFIDDRHFFNQKNGAMRNGPLVQFLMNIDVTVMAEPQGYSKEAIQRVMDKYDQKAIEINKTRNDWAKNQTVIFTLSESFSDPSRLPNIKLNRDPIPFVRNISKNTTSGLMLSSGYGGGTANMEWQSLTGMDMSNLDATLPIAYTQLVDKQKVSPTILNLFDESIAIHPFGGTLYNRLNVYKKFGFEKFHYLNSPDGFKNLDKIDKNPYVSDRAAYKETIDVINNNQDKTQFIQLTTMQNHMPYNNYYENNQFEYEGKVVSDANRESMNTYLKGLKYSDEALQDFISEIDNIQKPITLVWYGDHLPGIYEDQYLEKYPFKFRETDYFVYNNKFIQNQWRNKKYEIVSPYKFPAVAFEQANIALTPFYALLTEVATKLPSTTNDPRSSTQNVYNGQKSFISTQNEIVKESDLSKNQRKLLNDYMLIQYDLVAGSQYSAKWAQQKGYK